MGNNNSTFSIQPQQETTKGGSPFTISTRSEATRGREVKDELGIVVGYSGEASYRGADKEATEDRMRLATKMACDECEKMGGNALLAVKYQLASKGLEWSDKVVLTGTCCRVEPATKQ